MILRLNFLTNNYSTISRLMRWNQRQRRSRRLFKGFYWIILVSFILKLGTSTTTGVYAQESANNNNNDNNNREEDERESSSLTFNERRLNLNNNNNNNHHHRNNFLKQIQPITLMQKQLQPLTNRLSLQVSPKTIRNSNHFIAPPPQLSSSPPFLHHQHGQHHLIHIPNKKILHQHHHQQPPGLTLNRHSPPNDLQSAAQTLYDLRGFHIPLGGQEETQRFLRQQNELDHQHRTKPLVFPSFFQPQTSSQQYLEAQPQAINIFGHNQHHQQTNRFVLAPPRDDTTFRPSQPDLSLTTSTENVFKPIRQQQPEDRILDNSNNHNRNPNNNNNNNNVVTQNEVRKEIDDDPFVYVYDELDYDEVEQEEAELEKAKQSSSSSSSQIKPQEPSLIRSNQPTAVIETSTTTNAPQTRHEIPHVVLNQNHFDIESQRLNSPTPDANSNNNHNFFIRENTPQFHAGNPFNAYYDKPQVPVLQPQRPRVEIVPSSERKPPPDQSNSINQNYRARPSPIVYEDRLPFDPQKQNDFKPSVRFIPPPPPSHLPQLPSQQQQQQQGHQNFVTHNEIPHFNNRNQNYIKNNQQRPIVIGHDFNGNQVIQNPNNNNDDAIIVQKYNSPANRDLLHPQRIRPVNTIFPHVVENASPAPIYRDQYIVQDEDGVSELVEVLREPPTEAPTTSSTSPSTTAPSTTTTPATTTLRPFRRNPFANRHRLLPTGRTATASTTPEPTSTTVPRRRGGVRSRLKTSTTTTPAPALDLSENYVLVSDDEDEGQLEEPVRILNVYEESPVYISSTTPETPVLTRSRQRIATTTSPSPVPTITRQKPQRQFYEEVTVQPQLNIQENLILENQPIINNRGQGQREIIQVQPTPPQISTFPTFPEQFGVVHQQNHNQFLNGIQERPHQRGHHLSNQRTIQPQPTVKSGGKPLYLNAKDKEGGLYSDYIIPIGHIYGSPIPFLPINQILDKMPGLFDGHSISSQIPRTTVPAPRSERFNNKQQQNNVNQRKRVNTNNNNIRPVEISRQNPTARSTTRGTTTTTTTTTTTSAPIRISEQPRRNFVSKGALESETKLDDELGSQTPSHGGRIKPLRRRIKPRPSSLIESNPSSRVVISEARASPRPSTSTARTIPTPSLEVSPPATPKPNPLKRRPRPRIRVTTTTTSTTTPTPQVSVSEPSRESDEEEFDTPRPQRKLIRKQRPTRRSFRKVQINNSQFSEPSEEAATPHTSVQIFRKPTETPGRFSSRFRDEASPAPSTTPIPTEIVRIQETIPQQPIKIVKPLRKLKPTKIASSESREDEVQAKPIKKQPQSTAQPGELPEAIFLKPKDVLVNRKPARRIPPGSASEKLKALQEKRRNLLTNRFSQRRPATPKPTVAISRKLPESDEDEEEDDDDDEDDEEEYDDSEPSKREITQKHSAGLFRNTAVNISNSPVKQGGSLSKFKRPNSTNSNSEEVTRTVLGLPNPTKALLSSPSDETSLPPLSIVEWFQQDENEKYTTTPKSRNSKSVDNTEEEPEIDDTSLSSTGFNLKLANFLKSNPLNQRNSTRSPFDSLTMSTNEPSLPLEAYFPIVSAQSSNSKESNTSN